MNDSFAVGDVGTISETYLGMYPQLAAKPQTKYVIVKTLHKTFPASHLKGDAETLRMYRTRYGNLKEFPIHTLIVQKQNERVDNPNYGYMLSQFGFQKS